MDKQAKLEIYSATLAALMNVIAEKINEPDADIKDDHLDLLCNIANDYAECVSELVEDQLGENTGVMNYETQERHAR